MLQLYATYPEIFPHGMNQGFCFHDWVVLLGTMTRSGFAFTAAIMEQNINEIAQIE